MREHGSGQHLVGAPLNAARRQNRINGITESAQKSPSSHDVGGKIETRGGGGFRLARVGGLALR
jgi:hypothetical protein